jgi:NAD(P)-dependent dehydrogenase (short-subunit alcohol dehydrogenase family)
MKDFNGKLAVVTGGASGVGFAIGEALANQGAKGCPNRHRAGEP